MNSERIYTVLRAPHVSEKAAMQTELANQFVFQVSIDATKSEIKKAVEALFKVKVSGVTTLKAKGKVKRNRFGLAKRADVKKAYVRLADGHDIDFTAID